MKISEAFAQYIFEEIRLKGGSGKTIQNYAVVMKSFTRVNGDVPVSFITNETILNWKVSLADRGIQNTTIKSSLCCLRQVLRYLRRRNVDVIDYRDIDLPKIVRKEATWLEIDELREILGATRNVRDKAIIATLFSCGGRVGEVLSLNRDSIVDNKAQVRGKGGKLNTLRFDDSTIKLINEYLETRSDQIPALFISGQYRRITVQRVEQILHRAAGEAGIEKNVTPHVLRHTFATDLRRNGADLFSVMKQLNHNSISSTQIYTHAGTGVIDESYTQHHTKI
jgi:integrase/recombinase XerD